MVEHLMSSRLHSVIAAILPVAPALPVALPKYGPPAIVLFGSTIPILPMALSLLGLWLARMVTLTGDRKSPVNRREWVVTLLLTVCLVGLVIEFQPGPGTGLIYGVGFGGTGLLVVEAIIKVFRSRAERVTEAMFGDRPPAPPPPPSEPRIDM